MLLTPGMPPQEAELVSLMRSGTPAVRAAAAAARIPRTSAAAVARDSSVTAVPSARSQSLSG